MENGSQIARIANTVCSAEFSSRSDNSNQMDVSTENVYYLFEVLLSNWLTPFS